MEQVFSIVLTVIGVYMAIGLIFGLIFIDTGLKKVDKNAQEASRSFRLLILPGLLIFWPFFLKKWIGVKS